MEQEAFDKFYRSLREYAYYRARRVFYDVALMDLAIDAAMDRVVDWMLKNPGNYPTNYCKTIIRNSLSNSQSRRKEEPATLKGTLFYGAWGFRGRRYKE